MADGTIATAIGAPPPVAYVADQPLTDAQAAALASLRSRGAAALARVRAPEDSYWASDHALRRVLGARRFDVDKALHMLEEIVRWRNEVQAWRFLDPAFYREPEALRRWFPWGFAGVDKEGFPVLIERIGHADLLGMHDAVGTDEFLRWVIFYHETQERMMRTACAALGKDRHKMTVIVDLRGYNMRLASPSTLAVLNKRTRLEEDHYPEVVKRLFLINTPSLFASVWTVVAYFMDEGTRNKVQLLSDTFLPTMLQFIEPSNVPAFLGGTLTDCRSDAECRSSELPRGAAPPLPPPPPLNIAPLPPFPPRSRVERRPRSARFPRGRGQRRLRRRRGARRGRGQDVRVHAARAGRLRGSLALGHGREGPRFLGDGHARAGGRAAAGGRRRRGLRGGEPIWRAPLRRLRGRRCGAARVAR